MQRRVLFSASTFSHIMNFHLPYIQEFQRLGWQVDVACGGQPTEVPGASRVIPVPFKKSMTSPKNMAALQALRRLFRREHYDLVTCHTALASFFTRMALRGLKSRPAVVCMVHGYLFDNGTPAAKRFLLEKAERLTAPVTDLLLTMNQWDYTYASAQQLGAQVKLIPGVGVDFARLHSYAPDMRMALRAEWGFNEDSFLLIYAAEFSARKSQQVLLHALARLPERVCLLLPGQGALLDQCKALAARLGLEGRVVFPGQVSNMPAWYAAADAAVSASRSEGLPFNIMEAMYCGLPVVASAVKGHLDLISEEETGLLYPYGDSDTCAEKIHALMSDRTFAARLGRAAAQSVQRYGLTQVLQVAMNAYLSVVPEGEAAVLQ